MSALTDAAKRAPREPGVYVFLGSDGELLYVGKATDLHRRLTNHARDESRTNDLRRHVLLNTVRAVHWELCCDDRAALVREADLIVMLKPTFNASHAEQNRDHFLIVNSGSAPASFELTGTASRPGRVYGTFPHLAKGAHSHVAKRTKLGYTALLRLLWAVGSPDRAARMPVRISGSSPPSQFAVPVAPESRTLLHNFLSGRSARLLPALLAATATADIPAFARAALERDAEAAGEFFELAPRPVRRFRLRHQLARTPVSGAVMAELLAQELSETTGEFHWGLSNHADAFLGRRAARERELRDHYLRAPGPVSG
jgi:predicted GIY-YIG superfamily endonuclease